MNDPHSKLEFRYAPGNTCEITSIEVDKDHRGKGIGTKVLEGLERRILKERPETEVLYAFTSGRNTLAQEWYGKRGFSLLVVPKFYGRNGSAVLCWKLL